jgi:hypothetical protein
MASALATAKSRGNAVLECTPIEVLGEGTQPLQHALCRGDERDDQETSPHRILAPSNMRDCLGRC